MKIRTIIAMGAITMGIGTGCATKQEPVKIVVPSTASPQPPDQSHGTIPSRRHEVRISNGSQDREVAFPAVASGYYRAHPPSDRTRGEDASPGPRVQPARHADCRDTPQPPARGLCPTPGRCRGGAFPGA